MPEIRLARDDEGPQILKIMAVVFAEYPGCWMEESEYPELVRPATTFAALGGCLWVAEQDGSIVGSVGMVPESPHLMELKKLYTLPQVRGIGLGRRLIETVEAEARLRQAHRIHLWSDTRFVTAHRVYERLGYRRLPEIRALLDVSNSHEYHFEKVLSENSSMVVT